MPSPLAPDQSQQSALAAQNGPALAFPAVQGLSQQEQYLLDYHRNHLQQGTYLKHGDDISTVYITTVLGPDGKYYNVPGYFTGALHENEDEVKAHAAQLGWQNFPSYPTGQEGDAAAKQLHGIIDKDMDVFRAREAK